MSISDSINNFFNRNEAPNDPKHFCLERVLLFSQNPNQQLLTNGIYNYDDVINLATLNKGSILRCNTFTKFKPGYGDNFTAYDWFVTYNENLLFRILTTGFIEETKFLKSDNNFMLKSIKPYTPQFYVTNIPFTFFGVEMQTIDRTVKTEYKKVELMESGVTSKEKVKHKESISLRRLNPNILT